MNEETEIRVIESAIKNGCIGVRVIVVRLPAEAVAMRRESGWEDGQIIEGESVRSVRDYPVWVN
jgi:hypothetical protein